MEEAGGKTRGAIGIEVLPIAEDRATGVTDVVTMIEIDREIGARLRVVATGTIVIEMVGDIGGMREIVGEVPGGTTVIERVTGLEFENSIIIVFSLFIH